MHTHACTPAHTPARPQAHTHASTHAFLRRLTTCHCGWASVSVIGIVRRRRAAAARPTMGPWGWGGARQPRWAGMPAGAT
eukprot:8145698-Alexandrium_andersonii.AAC.1